MPKSAYFLSPVVFALLFIGCCLWLRWPLWESAFLSDGSPLSWLSSVQMFAVGVLACRLGAEQAIPRLLAIWLAISMAYMAIDEQFMLHEQWKYGCVNWWQACSHGWVRDLPMLMVVGFGLITVMVLHYVVQKKLARMFFIAAYMIGVLALAIDLLPAPASLAELEEGFEVMASAAFLSAMLLI